MIKHNGSSYCAETQPFILPACFKFGWYHMGKYLLNTESYTFAEAVGTYSFPETLFVTYGEQFCHLCIWGIVNVSTLIHLFYWLWMCVIPLIMLYNCRMKSFFSILTSTSDHQLSTLGNDFSLWNYMYIITSVLRFLHRIINFVHCCTYHNTFMPFRYLQLDIFTLINIIYCKHFIIL